MSRPQPEEQTYYTREEFRRWCEAQVGGRYERVEGRIAATAPERARHVRVKYRVFNALARAIQAAGVQCEVIGDGMAVEAGESDYQPDALVNCGPPIDDEATSAPNPVIVVEVISPSTLTVDTTRKFFGYFQVPSLVHYLIVDPERQIVIHHRREPSGAIATAILRSGGVTLDPPGIALTMEEFYAA